MKRIYLFLLLAILLSMPAGQLAAQRLPEMAVPEHYALTFAPDFTKDKFSGDEAIDIQLLKPVSQIVLNAVDIDFHHASVTSGGVTQQARVVSDNKKETATLVLNKPIQAGLATVQMQYTGILHKDLRGFYVGKEEDGKKYAVTQFESTDARRAFPSFDEPAYKATFDVTVIADAGNVAISNGKLISDTPGPGEGKHTVRFATTAKMSSYLVAVVVGNFEYLEGSADGIPIRVWTPPGKKHLAAFGLETAEQSLRYFDKYFDIKYPFEKLDMIALPDFAAGAMENTAAITYREIDLLLDEKRASVDQEKEVAATIAHEIAHQWVGDLVTMKWWDDIWLNEGFATWMEDKAVAVWKPEWRLDLDRVQDGNRALNTDSLASTRPIHQAAETPGEIEELFDGIAYGKAAAVLEMLEAYLGPDVFRAGVREYLKEHAYGTATAADVWNALAKVSNKPVEGIMATFVMQPGAPLISVNSRCTGTSTSVTLSQKRYFYDINLFRSGSGELWITPACLKPIAEAGGGDQQKCELLSKRQETFTFPGCAEWVLGNAGATGYYRSGYEAQPLLAMERSLETQVTPAERIRLLGDEWASVQTGQPIGNYLALTEGLQAERNRAVMDEWTEQLTYIGKYLLTESDRDSYEQWVQALLSPAATELGWRPAPGEEDNRKVLRAQVLYTLGHTGRDPKVIEEAQKLAQLALENPSVLDATMAATVFGLAAENGDASLYNKIKDQIKKTSSPEEYNLLLDALARFRDPALLERTLQFALAPEVRNQDAPGVIASVMENSAGARVAWHFLRTHWGQIEQQFDESSLRGLISSTSFFCDAGLQDEVNDFFAAHPVPAAERTMRQAVERVKYCVDLKSQQESQLAAWLERHGSSAGK